MSETSFRNAEDFLAELGVERRPIVVKLPEAEAEAADGAPSVTDSDEPQFGDGDHAEPDSTSAQLDTATMPPLDEAIAAAISTIRRITAAAPASEGRLRRKLEQRELPAAVVDGALERARRERLVDDDALAAALVAEWRAAGHGASRIRLDLQKREFDDGIIERAVAAAEQEDPFAGAFALATERAEKMRHVEAEIAYRRVAAYVARRGYPDALARKAARDAVFDDRERERTAGH